MNMYSYICTKNVNICNKQILHYLYFYKIRHIRINNKNNKNNKTNKKHITLIIYNATYDNIDINIFY